MKYALVVALSALALAGCEDAGVNRVEDGERLVVNGHKLRLHQIDAPEIADAKCDAERAAGELAVERLQGVLLAAASLEFSKTDAMCQQFMWCDATLTADGHDVGEMLVTEGLAVRGTPVEAKLDAHDWCAAPLTADAPALVVTPGPSAADENAESGLESAPLDEAPALEEPVQEEIESRPE